MRVSYLLALLVATFVAFCGCNASADDSVQAKSISARRNLKAAEEGADPEGEERNAFTDKLGAVLRKVRFIKTKAQKGEQIDFSKVKTWDGRAVDENKLRAQIHMNPDPNRVRAAMESPELRNVRPPIAKDSTLPTAADVTAMRSYASTNLEDGTSILMFIYGWLWVGIALFGITIAPVIYYFKYNW
ncbi:unnamed protein product [Phytophthora lilii]|uniref:Unnamed protein product n=1 Tax=Phytophthora lilii TaxID=2077276 RepID=A0A9W6TLH0_9STRA|nr:unnamed protein product [Phytophthora lilii]